MLVRQDAPDQSTASSPAGLLRGLTRATNQGRNNPFGYLFIAPAVILYLVFNIWPLIRGFLMAFTDYRFLYADTRWDFNGLANFQEMFQDKAFWNALGVTVRYVLMVFPATIIIALLLALLISNVSRAAGFYRWAAYLPTILPIAVTFLMFGEMFNFKFGFVNVVLRGLGVANAPNWIGDVRYVLPTLALADVWRSIGFPTLLFLIGMYNINGELYEAAAIDGASGRQRFWRITLPLLKPSFVLVLILNLGVFGATEPMLLLTSGGPQNASQTLGYYAYQVAFRLGDLRLGYAAAISLFTGLISALIALVVYRLLRDRENS